MRQPVAHILLMGVLGAVILLGVATGSVTANETEEIDGLSEYSEEEIKVINKLIKNISAQRGLPNRISPAWTPIGSTGCKIVSEGNLSVKYCPPEFGELTQIEEAVEPGAQTVRVPYNGAELTITQDNESNTFNSEEHSGFRWDKSGFLSYQDYGDDRIEVNIDHDDRHGGQYDYQLTATIPPRDIGEHTKYQMTVSGIVEWDFLIGWNTIEKLPEREFQGEPYYTFEDVHDVAVIYADFEGDEQAENKHGQLDTYQSRITSKINKYMAHSIGAMGLEGYDFSHYDNDGEWHVVVPGTPQLIADEFDDFINTSSAFGRRAIRESKGAGYFENNYDTTIVVSAGDQSAEDHFDSSRAIYNISDDFVYVNEIEHEPQEEERAKPLGEGVWIHELGHALGYGDLYEYRENLSGGVAGASLMGSGHPDMSPMITPTRTEYHTTGWHADCDDIAIDVNIVRPECPWLYTQSKYGMEDSYEEMDLWAETDHIEETDRNTDVVTWAESEHTGLTYVFETRGHESEWMTIRNHGTETNVKVGQHGTYMYRVDEMNDFDSIIQISNPDLVDWGAVESNLEAGDYKHLSTNLSAPTFPPINHEDSYVIIKVPTENSVAEFKALDENPNSNEYQPIVAVKEADVDETYSIEMLVNHTLEGKVVTQRGIPPAVEFQAETPSGDVSGVVDGELVTEIDGMNSTDIMPYSVAPFAHLPADQPVRYSVNTDHMEAYFSDLEDGQNTSESSSDSAQLDLEFSSYSEDEGETKTVSQGSSIDIDNEGETKPIGASGNLSVMPRTLNRASSGRWVTAKLEIPFDDIDLDSVDVSSFKLNGEVDAVADERYGFVRNPVGGNELLLKFPRAEVIDLLETGDEVDVTVSGTLESGEILIGDDEIRVINEGNRSDRTTCATWRDRVSQNAIVHAMFPCPPGLQDRAQMPGEGAPPVSQEPPRGPQDDRSPASDRPSAEDPSDHERSPAGDDETSTRADKRGRGPPEDGPPAGEDESRGPPERADQAKERSDEARGPPQNPRRGPNPRLTPGLSGLGQINTVP